MLVIRINQKTAALSVCVEVTLRSFRTGEQLGQKVVFDLCTGDEHGTSLGALIAMGKEHEHEAANYTYYFPDG